MFGKNKNIDKNGDRQKVDELLFAIMNSAHAEYHYIELLSKNNEDANTKFHQDMVDSLRNQRRSLMEKLAKLYPVTNQLWCVLKHLLLSYFHLLECYEGDHCSCYLRSAKTIMNTIQILLHSHKEHDALKPCERCDEGTKTHTPKRSK